jgi:non-specific serine/threonine protein kinase/serine/threonine-protein kinase
MAMDAENWTRVEQLCQEALEHDEGQQSAFLDSACGTNQELRREVESLLAYRQRAGTFLEAPAVQMAAEALTEEAPSATTTTDASRLKGRLISHYRIAGKVASGGMGDVYRAVRADGTYDKQVAVKIIQLARSSDFFLGRFQNERQILANLEHPNIARLVDGGTTEEGLPYLVMEFIEGQRIDEFCARNDLGVRERLELFRTVCSAVHYAHQTLVVHRDLKPSNILVTTDGVPKLLDFGIAKILDPQRAEAALQQTITLLRMFTPEYASPEQVRNEPISTSSDVYSLGVILYELLTGRLPYRVPTDSPQEMMKAVCDTEPERPSTAALLGPTLEAVGSKYADTEPALEQIKRARAQKLRKILAGDLDNIVLKALRKEPQRRYASVEQFSEDIRRYLAGLPVLAHEDSRTYRARKFIGRHKVSVIAAALLVLSLAGGLVATLWQAHIARTERARAERRFNDVRKLANSLIFEVHDSIRDLPGTAAARKLIIQRAQEYLDSLAQESNSDPALLRELAAAYGRLASVQGDPRDVNLGDTRKAVENDRKSVALLESAVSLQPSNRDLRRELAESYTELAIKLDQAGDAGSNKIYLQKAAQVLESLAAANADDKKVQYALAKVYEDTAGNFRNKRDSSGALESYEKADAIYQRLGKADPQNQQFQREISFSHKHLGGTLIEQKKLPEALEQYRAALAIDEAQLARNPDSVQDRYNITYTYSDTGFILGKQGDFDAALAYYRKAFEIRAALVAADPNDNRTREGLSNTLNYIGYNLFEKKDYRAALESYKKAAAIRESLSQKDPANQRLRFALALSESNIGNTYAAMAFSKAVPSAQFKYCRESLDWNNRSLPVWMERKTQGKLGPEAETLAMSTRNIEACNRVVAQLDSTTKPPAQ